ncbi:MAG: competence/damage-inducible protein A [Elusimicrobiota bacterium]
MARAEIICVGTELLTGKTNTHVSYLTPKLLAAGLEIPCEITVVDDPVRIAAAVRDAAARADAVIVCGGLGPTFDDITREACADALGRPLRYQPALYGKICRKFRRYGMAVPANNKRQAWLLKGARALDNPRGSAPGQLITLSQRPFKCVALLPGPFLEMSALFERDILPLLRRRLGAKRRRRERVFRFCGLSEAAADKLLRPLLDRPAPGVEFTILAGLGHVSLHTAASAASAVECGRRLREVEARVRRIMRRHLFGLDDDTLESAVGELLRRRRRRLATAESCSGGLLAKNLTDIAGSSDYFAGGVVAYANEIKTSLLGVAERTLKRYGAVSSACAHEMAAGALRKLGADTAISITGTAGPGGGTRAKPVGWTYIGLAFAGRRGGVRVRTYRFHFPGRRAGVRKRAVQTALFLLWRALRNKP